MYYKVTLSLLIFNQIQINFNIPKKTCSIKKIINFFSLTFYKFILKNCLYTVIIQLLEQSVF